MCFIFSDSVSGLFCNLIIVLASGRVVFFGEKVNYETVCLPESVKSSCLFESFLITSNQTDCYSSMLHIKKEISLSSFLLTVKGMF